MNKPFSIKKICIEDNRPPYPIKIDEYFEEFVTTNILKPFDIILNDEWKVILSIMIFRKEPGAPEGVSIYEPDAIEEEKVMFYPVGINLEDIYKSEDHVANIVGLYYQIISLFFLSNYKNIPKEHMVQLMDKIDWDYLFSLPYPAPSEDQGYVIAEP